jgi:hypothetical protein
MPAATPGPARKTAMTRSRFHRVALSAACALAVGGAPAGAGADGPGLQVFAGLSAGGVQRVSFENPDCVRCLDYAAPAARSLEGPVYTLAFGVGGTERWFRGGAEIVGMVGSGPGVTGGYAGVVTYAGFETRRTTAQAGVGIGVPWITDGHRWGTTLDGNVHLRVGVRVTDHFALITRGDLLKDSRLGSVVTAGLEWAQ